MATTNTTTCEGTYLDFSGDPEGASLAQYSPLETVFVTIVIPVVSIVGLFGNITYLFTVARVRRLRSMTVNYYLVVLAIVDAFSTFGFFMFFIWPYLASPVSYDVPYTCWFTYGMLFTSVQASVGLVTVVAIERYMCICRPWQYRVIASKKRTIQLIVMVFIIAVILSVLTTPFLGKNVTLCITWPDMPTYKSFPSTIQQCQMADFAFPFMIVIFNDVPIYIVLVLSCVLYWKIVKTLHQRKHLTRSQDTDELRDQVARMLIVNGCVFFICQIPARILNMGLSIGAITQENWISPQGEERFIIILQTALLLNSAANPYIYGAMSSHYRHAVWEAFRWSSSTSEATGSSEGKHVSTSGDQSSSRGTQITLSVSKNDLLSSDMDLSQNVPSAGIIPTINISDSV